MVVSGSDDYDVFHRPSQIYDRAALGRFLDEQRPKVITVLDLISYRTPALFATRALHDRYCGFLRSALEAADAVLAISEHARGEILDEFGLDPARVHAVHLGVDAE